VSDISINITWLDLILASPVLGWPGLLLGGALGALLWKRRRIIGGALAAVIGGVAWAVAVVLI
jgi:putative Mn2+ efflux pump MntP